ncbi:MAG: ABC transporter ATP-binding protein [Alphaproteobacteria bacterium]
MSEAPGVMSDAPEAGAALCLAGVERRFRQGGAVLEVLRGVDLAVRPGEIVALMGPSGAGKSTLLQIAGLLEAPDAGEVFIQGTASARLADDRRTALRRTRLGFVYQFHHLLPDFSALENVMLPQLIAGRPRGQAEERGRELLAMMRLGERADHRPGKLSGGEQQRVAIARAVANAPAVLLADEPTGNLDHATSDTVFAELAQLVRDTGLAAVVATHNSELAAHMDRVLHLQDGRLAAAAI